MIGENIDDFCLLRTERENGKSIVRHVSGASMKAALTRDVAQKLARITKSYVLICEGKHDSEFFENLIQVHSLPQFDVCSANFVLGINHGGNTRFTEALDALVSLPGFPQVKKYWWLRIMISIQERPSTIWLHK